MNELRWGILSTAGIARKNWRAIRDSGNSVVSAVGSREVDRSCRFIADLQRTLPFDSAPRAFGSYEELIASPEVDAVYIPLPTGLRKEWVLRAAAARKHVLCEKPCGLSAADVLAMTNACRDAGVQFMDGVMFMHNPRLARVREVLDDAKSIGRIRRISSAFSFLGDEAFHRENIRIHSELEPTGCLGDLGWYCIRFALWAMNWQLPREVSGQIFSQRACRQSPGAAPTDFSGELVFEGEISSGFFCSFMAAKQQWVHVSGEKGALYLPDFVHPNSDHEPAFEVNDTAIRIQACDCVGKHGESRGMAQDAVMFRNFADQVRSGTLNADWPMMAWKTQQVMDACFKSAKDGGRAVKV